MQNTDSEHGSNDEQVLPEKPKQVRIKRALWRYNEDGTYNNNPISPTYYKDYYLERVKHLYLECPYCKKSIHKPHYARHINTAQKCLKYRNIEERIEQNYS